MGNELPTYQFVAGWMLLILILMFINKTRLGHVIIYYGLMMLILTILIGEYKVLAPLIGGIQTVGQLSGGTTGSMTNG